jgi:NAD+ kinase
MTPSAEPVRTIAVVSHGDPDVIAGARSRLQAICESAGIEIVDRDDVDLAVVLGGDGTTLRALHRFLGTPVPVLGVNFGRVGFLAAVSAEQLEDGLRRAFAGDYRVVELPALDARAGAGSWPAVNDVVVTSSSLGRMIELGWAVGGEDLGVQPCDGLICSTPSGSTAYNLSNGGPVLVWGLEAMAVTFVAPHSLHARPLVVPRGLELAVVNRTEDVSATVLVDGHRVDELGPGRQVTMELAEQHSLLATLPESTFFSRYRRIFST